MSLGDLVFDLLRDRAGKPGKGLLEEEVGGEVVRDRSLLDFLRRTAVEEKQVHPPTPETWYRVSGLGYICPREEVLAALTQTIRYDLADPDEQMNYGLGSGWHFVMQNEFLGPHGVLLGRWECWQCHRFYGTDREPAPRPPACECKCDRFLYHELYLRHDEYRLHGHPDGIVTIGGRRRLLELKTANEKNWKRVDMAPFVPHVIQANAYMWMLGLREALVVYLNKNGYGLRALKVFEIEYDQDLVNGVLSKVTTIRRCMKTGELPPRLVACDRPAAEQAKKCPLAKVCFGCKSRLEEAA